MGESGRVEVKPNSRVHQSANYVAFLLFRAAVGLFYVGCRKPGDKEETAVETAGNKERSLEQTAYGRRLILRGHSGEVRSIALTADGKMLASTGSIDQTVKVWDVATGHERTTLKVQSDTVESVAFTTDGKTLASGGGEYDPKTKRYGAGQVTLWDVPTGKALGTLEGHTGLVLSVAFSPDGKTLASGSFFLNAILNREDWKADQFMSGEIKLWDVTNRKERATLLRGHPKGVKCLGFTSDGKMLASGGVEDDTVKFWDVATYKEVGSPLTHRSGVNCLALTTDGRTMATAADVGTVKVWDVFTRQERTGFQAHKFLATAVAFTPDGKTLATGSFDGTVRLWDVVDVKERTLVYAHAGVVTAVAFTPDGKTMATSSYDKTVVLWDVEKLLTQPQSR
jgi:WD40 repeat protein